MTGRVDRDLVLASLTAEAVAATYGIEGRWSGRWLRSRRCATDHHATDAFGLARDGKWHCWSCNVGGDLLSLIAAAEHLDVRSSFADVLEIAASIAGVEPEPDFGAPVPIRRPRPQVIAPPPVPPLADRVATATARCRWVWSHLRQSERSGRHWYLSTRGIDWSLLPLGVRDGVRDLGFWTVPGDYDQLVEIAGEEWDAPRDRRVTNAIRRIYSSDLGVAVAVRHVETGIVTDIRARRAEPRDGEPKILGMVGGVTVDARSGGAELVACYGAPHAIMRDLVIVVEGWADYLTAAQRWPLASVLGAVDAGQYPLVASFAARAIAERGRGRLVLVVQNDPGRGVVDAVTGETTVVPGAADRAANAAGKRATGVLGLAAVGWIEARNYGVKDLNDVAKAGRLAELPEAP